MTSHRPGFLPPSSASSSDGDTGQAPDPGLLPDGPGHTGHSGHPPVIPPLLAAPHFMSGMGNLMGASGKPQVNRCRCQSISVPGASNQAWAPGSGPGQYQQGFPQTAHTYPYTMYGYRYPHYDNRWVTHILTFP